MTGIASSLGWAGVRGVCEGKGTVGMRCTVRVFGSGLGLGVRLVRI